MVVLFPITNKKHICDSIFVPEFPYFNRCISNPSCAVCDAINHSPPWISASFQHLARQSEGYTRHFDQPVIRRTVIITSLTYPDKIKIWQKVHIQIETVSITCPVVEMVPAVKIHPALRAVLVNNFPCTLKCI